MSSDSFLALYLNAPLQSWGYASKYDQRTSLGYPTRSGILGLLCAALGIDRADAKSLQSLDGALEMTVYILIPGSMLTDYHTVGGGYDLVSDTFKVPRRASGGHGATMQTYREYLEDAKFGIVLKTDNARATELAQALQNPHWGIWLGRKSCIPAARIFEGVYADHSAALSSLRHVADCEDNGRVRVVSEAKSFAAGNDTLPDRPLDFTPNARRFAPRRVLVE